MSLNTLKEEIEKDFDEKFDHIMPKIMFDEKSALLEVKDFLSSALDRQREEIIKEIRKRIDDLNEPNDVLHEDLDKILDSLTKLKDD
jgi:DNA-binding ferritin-like protein